ncbi:trehalose-phosphatase [Methyloceanibacter caenitepidi]|uniref:Trehalose 6-phosphate phosphatase n=1 Tax=Methyloceanibacter caenitepidi TaxID=1384459 RepID=A0A0A8K6L9_9HYPH|nr:trehalose-phosphatase [Methyloceanibacter caenitepidi]BAQ18182.1 trehalose-6-phosphate phosphatase [Methyloceanibacter caenitepidi]
MTDNLPDVPRESAFFFDFDGTLVEIAPRPELVAVEPKVREVLEGLAVKYDGAVAIVTGRPLEAVDGFLAPIQLATAAEHGSIRRDATGALHVDEGNAEAVEAAYAILQPFVAANDGMILERKRSSIAIHYRQRPDLAGPCEDLVHQAVAQNPTLVILPGKMVFELKPKGVDKGEAVRAFLEEAPFQGRTPVFMGDDVTDEHAFEVVNALGGLSIKVDDGHTIANYRTDRKGLFAWLFQLVGAR